MEKNKMILRNNPNNNSSQTNGFVKPLGNHFENNQFINRNQQFQEQMPQQKNVFTQDIKTKQHTNPANNNEMYDKTLSLLHERLEQGSISLDEFNKKCEELGRKRQNENQH